MIKKTQAAITALALFLGCGAGGIYGQTADGNTGPGETPWTAHIDVTALRDSPLAEFLGDTLSLERVLHIRNTLTDRLMLDPETLESATFLGIGKKLQDTAIILRGSFGTIDLSTLPYVNGSTAGNRVRVFERTGTDEPQLFMVQHNPGELVAGTSSKAVEGCLSLLETKRGNWNETGLPEHARSVISKAIASLSLDLHSIGRELQFEAEFTRSVERIWLMAGTRGKDLELTLLIESNDAEDLDYLREQIDLVTMMPFSQKGAPMVWLELIKALKIETNERWMTVKFIAPPAQATRFLESLAPLFKEEAKPETRPNGKDTGK